ncbi:VOC family protein [Mesorhizobium sp. C277A]|uniref:VOC family protein n=1 Tax=Mesorhizobium sp. C277A TaxID=2956827 RepID=UPI000429E28A|nr:VOC family protein [Mesorhizobium sp. LSJC277A00]
MNDQSINPNDAASFVEKYAINPRVRVGHVHLNVADIERSLAFYCGALGFGVNLSLGEEAAFLAAGGYHHHLALTNWKGRGGAAPPIGTTGLHHVAFLYPTRAALAAALRRLRAAGVTLTGANDHGGSEAIYVRDPDGNGVELYWDRPEAEWPRNPDGALKLVSNPLDVDNLAHEGASDC